MASSIYRRGSRRATVKKRAAKKKTGTRTKRAAAKKVARRKVVVAKKKRVVRKRIAAKTTVRLARRKAKVASAKHKVVPKKKDSAKKRARAASSKKRRPARKSTAKKTTRKLTPAQKLKRRNARLERELTALRKAQEEARLAKKKRVSAKKRAADIQKKVEKTRIDNVLVSENLPRNTPKKRRSSQRDLWQELYERRNQYIQAGRENGQIYRPETPPRRIRQGLERGQQRLVRINRWVAVGNVEDILHKIDRIGQTMRAARRTFSNWRTRLYLSGIGEHLFGSDREMLSIAGDPLAHMVQAKGYFTTGPHPTYQSMFESLRNGIEDFARQERAMAFIHTATISNFTIAAP